MTRNFDAEIAEHDESLVRLGEKMGAARTRWLGLAAPWLASYWQAKARDIVVSEAEHAQTLGAAGIASLKAQVADLAGAAEQRLNASLLGEQAPRIWPDLKPRANPDDNDFEGGGLGSSFRVRLRSGREDELEAPAQLEGRMQLIRREVLAILASAGFRVPHQYVHDPVDFPWTREMAVAINAYADLHDAYVETLRALARTRRDQAQAEATDLWDEA